MRLKRSVILLTVAAVTAGAWLVFGRGNDRGVRAAIVPTAAERAGGDERADEHSEARERPWLYRLLGELGSRVERLEGTVSKLSAQEHPATEVNKPAAAAQPPPTTPVDFVATATSVLEGESRDAAWDAEFRSRVAAAFEDAQVAGTKVRAIDCRSTLCKLEVELPPNVPPMSVMQAVALQGANGGIWASVDEKVTPHGTALLYIARESATLPAPRIASVER